MKAGVLHIYRLRSRLLRRVRSAQSYADCFHIFAQSYFLFHIFVVLDPISDHSADHFRPCGQVVLFFPKVVYLFYDIVMEPEHNAG